MMRALLLAGELSTDPDALSVMFPFPTVIFPAAFPEPTPSALFMMPTGTPTNNASCRLSIVVSQVFRKKYYSCFVRINPVLAMMTAPNATEGCHLQG
jgi:hypothetical protein